MSKLDDQLGVLRDDIADLLGRLQHTDASPESEAEGRDAQGKFDDNGGLDSERGDGPQSDTLQLCDTFYRELIGSLRTLQIRDVVIFTAAVPLLEYGHGLLQNELKAIRAHPLRKGLEAFRTTFKSGYLNVNLAEIVDQLTPEVSGTDEELFRALLSRSLQTR